MPIFKDRDGAFVVTNAFINLTGTCEKRYQDEYPSDEDDEYPIKRQKTAATANLSAPWSTNEKVCANDTFTRLYAIALGTLPPAEQRVLGAAVAKLHKARKNLKPEPQKSSLYSLLAEDLLSDAEVRKRKDERNSRLGWMLQFVMKQPGLEVGEKAEVIWLRSGTIIPWSEVEVKLRKVAGVDKDVA